MLFASQGHPERVIPSVKNLVRPIRNALSLFNTQVLLNVLKVLAICYCALIPCTF